MRPWSLLGLIFFSAIAGGCQRPANRVASAEPPSLPVAKPVQRLVTNYVDFTGRTEAIQSVDIRPRVTGYLVNVPFKEGSEVKKGQLLFEIDPAPYKAQLDQALGQVKLYEASLKLAKTTYERDKAIAGAEMRRALGVAVFAGMLGVTFFGIFLTPVFYYVIRRLDERGTPDALRSGRFAPRLRRSIN
jgi:multidrug efflux pump subunit AcrA (membrane-fusion protein)